MSQKNNNLETFIRDLKEPEEYPGFLLWQASNLWYRNMKNTLKNFGTTFTQFTILTSLIYLSKNNESINQKQIALHAKIDIMMTSDVLKTLERKKLVVRYPNPKDRRHNLLKITQKGTGLLMEIFAHVDRTDIKFFKILGSDVSLFTAGLEKLIQSNYDKIYKIPGRFNS